jgi:hypothetical protein
MWGERHGAGAPLLDLAMRLNMKTFLSHKHCQALVERWWRGGFAHSTVTLDPQITVRATGKAAATPTAGLWLCRLWKDQCSVTEYGSTLRAAPADQPVRLP